MHACVRAVAAVRWAPGESAGLRNLGIYSASADGHVCLWTLAKSSLMRQVCACSGPRTRPWNAALPVCGMHQNTHPS